MISTKNISRFTFRCSQTRKTSRVIFVLSANSQFSSSMLIQGSFFCSCSVLTLSARDPCLFKVPHCVLLMFVLSARSSCAMFVPCHSYVRCSVLLSTISSLRTQSLCPMLVHFSVLSCLRTSPRAQCLLWVLGTQCCSHLPPG